MQPFFLILGIFAFFTLVGQAVLSGLKVRFGVLWSWLLSPVMGMGVVVLFVNGCSKWGHPIRPYGPWITLGLGLASLAILVWRRPAFPCRRLVPFASLLLFYLIYSGWPMFHFGFKWISYGNDDMANYTLAAERFLNNSYYFLPEQTQLEGTDYSQHLWFMHALQQIRPGSEMLLAWTCSLTGLNPHQIFMPVIFAMSLVQMCALGALVLYRGRYRKLALLAVGLLAISPLFSLGTLYQLIAQVSGIAMLIGACALMLREARFAWNTVFATGILVGSLCITYPEVAPFVATSICVYALRLRYAHREGVKPFVHRIIAIAVLTFVIIGFNTYQFINTLILQSLGSAGLGAMADISQIDGLVLFPWTLVPSFLPMVFGLHPFGVVGEDPMLSIVIALGIILLVVLLIRMIAGVIKGIPTAVLGIVMIPLGFYLFFKGQDFGLFKLGMFVQPVIAFFLAQGFLKVWDRGLRAVMVGCLLVYFGATIYSHHYYVRSSIGDVGGGLTEVVGASENGVAFKPPADVKYDSIESDIANVVSAKMLAMYTQGIDTRFLSRNYMDNVANIAPLDFLRNPAPEYGDQRSQMLRPLRFLRWMLPDELMKGNVAAYNMMPMKSIDNSWSETSFRHLDYKNPLFVALQTKYDHFNKFSAQIGEETGWREQAVYMYKPLSEVKDRLIFIHSEKGPHYYSSARYRAAFFQREREPISQGKRSFHGTGPYTMFEVLNPTDNIRLMIDFTRTSLGGERSQLPAHAVIVGDDTYPVNFVGAGSARIFSQPIKPQIFEGLSYIALDLGEEPKMIKKEVTGLMRLYGLGYNLDDRRLDGFTRDISIVTEDQYQRLKRPTRIAHLPDDIYNNPGLEYSGLYEDGWLGDRASICLAGAKKGEIVTFKGEIPNLPAFRDGGVVLTMIINGHEPEPVVLHPGTFTINRFVTEDCKVTHLELQFNKAETYGKADARHLTAFINEISVHPVDDLMQVIGATDRVNDGFQVQGVDVDGWAAKGVTFHLPPTSTPKVLDLQLELPGWASGSAGDLSITVNGESVYHAAATAGTYLNLTLPVTPLGEKVVAISATGDFPLPGQAGKLRSYRIQKLALRDFAENEGLDGNTIRTMPRYELKDVDQDGWAGRRSRLLVPVSAKPATAELQIEFPSWAGVPSAKFVFTLNGRVVYSEELARGVYKTISVPLAEGQPNELVLESSQTFPLPAPDQRQRSFRLIKVDLK
ncbi:MAG TPA: hypothetical protein VG838_11930 [Opitutaceae bacterium]|nr:hypothetical protein [Opitutaceae bacterium]